MNHLPSIEEFAEIKRLIVEKDPNDEDKFLRKLWDLASQGQEALTSDRHALGEMILEWAKKERRGADSIVQLTVTDQATEKGKLHYQREYGKRDGYNSALTDLQTFIKSEVMGKE